MRKVMAGMLCAVFLLSLAACSSQPKKPDMYIEKAQLSKEEEKISQLLGVGNEACIYDFKLDKTVKSVQFNTYQLSDGEWELISGAGGQQFSDELGRLALKFETVGEGLRISLQSENSSGSTQYTTEPEEHLENMKRVTSMLNNMTELSYEQEIPLVIQILTDKDTIRSYDVDYFFKPEEYEKQEYEHVYAVTVRFSQKSVGELDHME